MYSQPNNQGNPQQPYGNPSYGNQGYGNSQGYGNNQQDNSPMGMGDYLISMLLTMIPLVGIVLLFVWAFSSGTNTNKANWAKAMLIFMAVIVALYFMLFASLLSSLPK
jgi:NADH:ubiquinone oxidoreductase subunit 3 (subunit A)